jgi:ABC-2 type transport system permease protein
MLILKTLQWGEQHGRVLPLTYAVRLLEGIWNGEGWSAHLSDVAGLTVLFLLFTAISAKVFRWE